MTEEPSSRTDAIGLALLLALALLLRSIGLDSGMWYDEVQMLAVSLRQPFGELLTSYPTDNNHPLYSLLAWFMVAAFGETAWAIRLPAVAFGVASLWMLWVFARGVAGRLVAHASVALLVVSYHHVWFSQNARGYTGLLFFTLASSHCFLRSLRAPVGRAWIGHGVFLALGTFVHLTGVYVGLAHFGIGLTLLATPRFGPYLRKELRLLPLLGCVLGGVLSLALHAPLLPAMFDFFLVAGGHERVDAEWTHPLWMIVQFFEGFGGNPLVGALVAVAGLVVFVAGVRGLQREHRVLPWLLVAPAFLGLAVTAALGRNLWPRFFFFLAGFAVVILVRGLVALGNRLSHRRGAVFGAVLCGACIVASLYLLPRVYRLPKQDFVGARDWVEAQRTPDEPVLTVGLAVHPYAWLYQKSFVAIENAAELRGFVDGQRPRPWLLHTLPIFLESRQPDVARIVRAEFTEVRRFPGTVGGGDVVVLRPKR